MIEPSREQALIARYEEGGSFPKPRSWANCDELETLFSAARVSNSSQLAQLLGFGNDPPSSYLAISLGWPAPMFAKPHYGQGHIKRFFCPSFFFVKKRPQKKGPKCFPSGGRGNPGPLPSIRSRDDIKHLQTTNRHPTPGLAAGRPRRHGPTAAHAHHMPIVIAYDHALSAAFLL